MANKSLYQERIDFITNALKRNPGKEEAKRLEKELENLKANYHRIKEKGRSRFE